MFRNEKGWEQLNVAMNQKFYFGPLKVSVLLVLEYRKLLETGCLVYKLYKFDKYVNFKFNIIISWDIKKVKNFELKISTNIDLGQFDGNLNKCLFLHFCET